MTDVLITDIPEIVLDIHRRRAASSDQSLEEHLRARLIVHAEELDRGRAPDGSSRRPDE